jgi:hypothetical protein
MQATDFGHFERTGNNDPRRALPGAKMIDGKRTSDPKQALVPIEARLCLNSRNCRGAPISHIVDDVPIR